MTGRSLLPLLRSGKSGLVDPTRTWVLCGLERHVFPQPARALRTAAFLYIRNFDLKSWPAIEDADPLPRLDYTRGEWLADPKGFPLNLEQSPTLQFLFDQRNSPSVQPFYTRATAAHPREELYDLASDPAELHDVVAEPKYAVDLSTLRRQLADRLAATGDPRSPEGAPAPAPPARDTQRPAGSPVPVGQILPAEPERRTAAAIEQAPVDFRHPPRDYVTHHVSGWDVQIEKELVDRAPELARDALARLERKLAATAAVLPAAALPDLRRLKIFVLYGPEAKAGGRAEGLEYFPAQAADHQDWLDPRMERSIVIYCAANYTRISEFWALKALVHEFGHAQHLEHGPEDRAEIHDTWSHARAAGLYQVVREEDRGTHRPNYAAQNHLEYFAELTAMYFVGANYFPRDRAGLKAYDPAGHALVEAVWGLHEAAPLEPGVPHDPIPQNRP
jgi:hypothetical protein